MECRQNISETDICMAKYSRVGAEDVFWNLVQEVEKKKKKKIPFISQTQLRESQLELCCSSA